MMEAIRHLMIEGVIPILVLITAPGYILAWFVFPIWALYDLITFLSWRLRKW